MNGIIIYYSRAGENYISGLIKSLSKGNTEFVASIIQELTGADLFKIEQKKPYSDDYNKCIAETKEDQRNNKRPILLHNFDSLEEYDIIYLGYPNYWGTMPMAMFTFLEAHDFSGKIIKPFCTHAGSGLGHSETDIKRITNGAMVMNGLAIKGAYAEQSKDVIREWLE